MAESQRLVEVDCTDAEAEKGCRECGGPIAEMHWATLKWAAANWYCSRECAVAVESRSNDYDAAKLEAQKTEDKENV